MTDEVLLEGMRFYGYHGVNPEERTLGQRFVVDVAIAADLRAAGMSDDLERTVNYSTAYKLIHEIVEGEPRQLIEAVAESIATKLLDAFPTATGVTVTIHKPEVPLKGAQLNTAAVRIRRQREPSANESRRIQSARAADAGSSRAGSVRSATDRDGGA